MLKSLMFQLVDKDGKAATVDVLKEVKILHNE